ncbi:MAG: prolipoprotein diacylglyceryl transferase [Candidatus Sumerlaeota bacterium]|nr:prolipoprotein diacylglyceryl transferase [Candidatus Sumerlaeota bacterium]
MHPILIRFGNFFIGTYGLFAAIGLLTGVFTAARRAKRNELDENMVLDLAFIGIVAGLIGARLTYIGIEYKDFIASLTDPNRSPWEYILTRQGFVFGGGMIAGALAGAWFLRRRGAPVWHTADCLAPSFALGHAFGRLGCFSAGCCWGKVCRLPWAVTFPKVVSPRGEPMGFVYEDHLERGWIPPTATRSLPVHPTQLYEAAALALIFLALVWLWRRRRFEGQIFIAYMALYSAARFIIEFFRGDGERGMLLGLSTSQWIAMAAIGLAVWLWRARRDLPLPYRAPVKTPAAEPAPAAGPAKKKR